MGERIAVLLAALIAAAVLSLAAYLGMAFVHLSWNLTSFGWVCWRAATVISIIWALWSVLQYTLEH